MTPLVFGPTEQREPEMKAITLVTGSGSGNEYLGLQKYIYNSGQ